MDCGMPQAPESECTHTHTHTHTHIHPHTHVCTCTYTPTHTHPSRECPQNLIAGRGLGGHLTQMPHLAKEIHVHCVTCLRDTDCSEAEPRPPAFLDCSRWFPLKWRAGKDENRSPRSSLGTVGVNLDIKSILKKKVERFKVLVNKYK